jgi:hypothetical protein
MENKRITELSREIVNDGQLARAINSYLMETLQKIQQVATKQEIPWLNECFTIFYNEDNYLLTRKRFDRIK